MNSLRYCLTSFALVAALASVACKATVTTGEPEPPKPPAPVAPPPDKDNDSIVDASDACPDKPGPKNDDATKNGCPEEAKVEASPPGIAIVGNDVVIKEEILFDVGKAHIKDQSSPLLDAIATFIKTAGGSIDLIEVAGHADVQGNEKANLTLTDDRAKAVVDALVSRGVDAKKLRAKGYGQYCPIDPGNTPEAFARNRRVEFEILKMNGKPTGHPLGCDASKAKGVVPGPVM